MKETNKLLLWVFIFVLVAVDQLSKFLTKSNLELGESISILPWFKIFFIENNGFAFGLEIFGKYWSQRVENWANWPFLTQNDPEMI